MSTILMRRRPSILALTMACAATVMTSFGCIGPRFQADRATRAYPQVLHEVAVPGEEEGTIAAPPVVDIQVFRNGPKIELVNATPRSFGSFDLWVNQRYMRHVDALAAGQTITLSLKEFYDERGERFNAGGIFRTDPATPVRLVQIQTDEHAPLVGLIAIAE